MNTFYFDSVRFPGRQIANTTDMFLLFGQQGSKWPDAGLPARDIPAKQSASSYLIDVKVWVNPITRTAGRKSSAHRVRCLCPHCNIEVSAGRLFQHRCKTP